MKNRKKKKNDDYSYSRFSYFIFYVKKIDNWDGEGDDDWEYHVKLRIMQKKIAREIHFKFVCINSFESVFYDVIILLRNYIFEIRCY